MEPCAPHESVQLRVEGRVQGVGFRWYTRDCALRLGLTGCVRNLPDGSVEAKARGPATALSLWIDQVRRGPPMGHVLSCAVQRAPDSDGEYDGFVVLH